MAVQIIPSATIFVALLSVFATTLEQTSAFSTSSNHGRTNSLLSSSSSLRYEYQQRIGTVPVKQNCRAGDSHLFADASDTAVKAEEKQEDEIDGIPVDHAKTTPQFLAGLWKLIAKGNHMVRGVSATCLFLSSLISQHSKSDNLSMKKMICNDIFRNQQLFSFQICVTK